MRDVNEFVVTRTVIVPFPGKREYGLTDSEFSVGQTVERSAETGGKQRINLTERGGSKAVTPSPAARTQPRA